MRVTNPNYMWPPRSRICIYGSRGKLIETSSDRGLDLADTLMLPWPHNSRTVRLGFSTQSKRWLVWSEDALMKVENLIRYDIGFDGYSGTLKRLSVPGIPGTDEFMWYLRVQPK